MKYLSAVRKIEVGRNVKGLDSYCFCCFPRMETITLTKTDSLFGNGIVKCCYSLKFLGIPDNMGVLPRYLCEQCISLKNVSVPNGADTIPDNAFSECRSLEKITIPETVTSLGRSALNECLAMKELYLPEKVSAIDGNVFRKDWLLEEIRLTNGITEIPDYAFSGCFMLTELVIPATVTAVTKYAFENCKGMKRYYFLPVLPPKLSSVMAFNGIPADCKIYVPKGTLDAYQTADYWSSFASYMEEMDGDVS